MIIRNSLLQTFDIYNDFKMIYDRQDERKGIYKLTNLISSDRFLEFFKFINKTDTPNKFHENTDTTFFRQYMKNGKKEVSEDEQIFINQSLLLFLELFIDHKRYSTDYGNRINLNHKNYIAGVFNQINGAKNGVIYKGNIDIDPNVNTVLNILRDNFGIRDGIFLSRVKDIFNNRYSMQRKKDFKINVFLNRLDSYINDRNDVNRLISINAKKPYRFIKDSASRVIREKGSEKYIKFAKERRAVKIIRYNGNFVLYSANDLDYFDGLLMIQEFLSKYNIILPDFNGRVYNLNSDIDLDVLDYSMHRRGTRWTFSPIKGNNIWKQVRKELRSISKSTGACYDSQLVVVFTKVLRERNLETNLEWLIKQINNYLYRHMESMRLTKIDGRDKYQTKTGLVIDLWEWHKHLNTSIKNYVIKENDFFNLNKYEIKFNNYVDFLSDGLKIKRSQPGFSVFQSILVAKDKKDPFSGIHYNKFSLKYHDVHHKKPRAEGGLTELSNLILINKKDHRKIHSKHN